MQVELQFTYSTSKGLKASFHSNETMSVGEAIVLAEDMLKTGRTDDIEFRDTNGTTWTLKELKKWMEGIETEPHHVTLYFDGGFDSKTGRAGLGLVIYYDQNGKSYRRRKNALIDEIGTNNEAEYAALHLGLRELELLGVHHLPVTIIGDSKVVIHQLNGEWPCYEEKLSRWADRIDERMESMGLRPEYEAISRKENKEADWLASQAMIHKEIESTIELER